MRAADHKKLSAAAVLIGTSLWLVLPAAAQDAQCQPATQPDRGTGADRPIGPRGRAFGLHAGRRGVEHLAQKLFRAGPEDQGPLQPGEEEELLAFAQQHTPRLYRILDALRQRHPDKFRERLAQFAPRLRHLRRVYQRSPQLGATIQTYAENLLEIERGQRALQRCAPDSAERERGLQTLRNLVAQNVRLEADALEVLAGELEQQQAQRVEERIAFWTGDDVDPAALPPQVRELTASFSAATTDTERAAAWEALRAAADQQVRIELAALRERAAEMRRSAAEEVDRRMNRLLEAPRRPGGPSGGRGPRSSTNGSDAPQAACGHLGRAGYPWQAAETF